MDANHELDTFLKSHDLLILQSRRSRQKHQKQAPAFETASPRERALLVRERARGTVRVEERETHGLTSGLLDGARALEVVQVRRGEPRTRGIDLDACRFEGGSEGSVIARRDL